MSSVLELSMSEKAISEARPALLSAYAREN